MPKWLDTAVIDLQKLLDINTSVVEHEEHRPSRIGDAMVIQTISYEFEKKAVMWMCLVCCKPTTVSCECGNGCFYCSQECKHVDWNLHKTEHTQAIQRNETASPGEGDTAAESNIPTTVKPKQPKAATKPLKPFTIETSFLGPSTSDDPFVFTHFEAPPGTSESQKHALRTESWGIN